MDQPFSPSFIDSGIAPIGMIPVKRSLRRKHIGIKVASDGSCVLLAPQFATDSELQKAMQQLRPWLAQQQKKAESRQHLIHRFTFQTGAQFFFRGNLYTLQLQADPRSRIIKFDGEKLLTPSDDPAEIQAMLEAFYRRHTRLLATHILEAAATRYNIPVGDISVNGATRRFGSCSSSGDMNFSWHLAMYPYELIELVVMHEFAHRSEMNHSQAFYRVLASYLPDHRERNKTLKLWTHKLSAYPAEKPANH